MYANLVGKIIKAYETLGFTPNPRVYFDAESRQCSPLNALILASQGIDRFVYLGVFNHNLVYKELTKKFDWIWMQGFEDGFNLYEVKKHWNQYSAHAAGYKVGIEVRKQLRQIYYIQRWQLAD